MLFQPIPCALRLSRRKGEDYENLFRVVAVDGHRLRANRAGAEEADTLFGITLGKPYDYSLSECKVPTSARAEAPDVSPCWRAADYGNYPPTIVNVPYLADFVNLDTSDSHRDGPIIRISTLVRPMECAESLAKLMLKFGRPTEDVKIPMVNGYGAQWDARTITWKTEDAGQSEVVFTSGLEAPNDKCLIEASTKTYRDANPPKKVVEF